MYFSDEIQLIRESYTMDQLLQRIPVTTARSVFADITSVTGAEVSAAGQNGIKASARIVVHSEDYAGEQLLWYDGSSTLPEGRYSVYRTYVSGADTVELYVEPKAGR